MLAAMAVQQQPAARIAPGTSAEIGTTNALIARVIGSATGGAPPNLFTTLARNRVLFRRWLRFASALMPGGTLPRADSELVILRVAHNCGCAYELDQHERLAAAAGLDALQIARAADGAAAEGWSPRQALLLRVADELHSERNISDELWAELRPLLGDEQLIELLMLVGHYEMLAMTLNGLRVAPDPAPTGRPPRLVRAIQKRLERRSRR